MLKHSLEVLEFDKIKDRLNNYVFSGLGRDRINNINFNSNLNDIKKSLKETTELKFLLENTNFPAMGVHDIRSMLKRARMENSYLDAEDLVKTASTLKAFRTLKSYLQKNKEDAPTLFPYSENITTYKYIEDDINKAIDDNTYTIKDTASRDLSKIRMQIINYREKIEKKLNSLLRNKNYVQAIQENIITVREDRYVIPIKKDHKGKIQGIVLDTSSSGSTLFIEPSSVVEDNNTLMSLLVEEKQEIIRILKKITALITNKWQEIHENLKLIADFEFLYAKSKFSIETDSNEIDVNDNGIFKIKKAKHPLLTGEVIPIDLIIGDEYNMLIITGPNTGGKTVSLKNIGLLTLMVMAGLHIPADKDSKVSIVDNIFTDIGDEQSISQNLSTFSSHIKRISKILKKATDKSLVLIDEIGAGTDPREGSAIGIAVLEQLLSRKSKTLVTTHFDKIKNFALRKKMVETASCEFNIKTLSPTYHLLYGIPGDSNAITIAKRLGLHWTVLRRATKLFKKDGNGSSDSVIKTLTDEKKRYQELIEIYEEKLKTIRDKEDQIEQKSKKLKEKESQLKRGEIKDISELIQNTRRELLSIIKEAKSSEKDTKKLGKKINKIEKLSDEIKSVSENIKTEETSKNEKEILELEGDINTGDEVKIKNLEKIGKVVEIGKKGDVTVQVGGIKFVLPKSDLIKIAKTNDEKKDNVSVSVTTSSDLFDTPPYELNIIGMRGEEAVQKSERYIEALHYSEREMGRIVHGKGEGILRRLINDMLKNHPYVKSYKSAHPDNGGFGVTEVLIK